MAISPAMLAQASLPQVTLIFALTLLCKTLTEALSVRKLRRWICAGECHNVNVNPSISAPGVREPPKAR